MTDTTGEKKVPNIRFKGFTDAWEQRKLKKIAIINPKDSLPAKFNYVDLESVVGTNLEKYQLLTKTNAPSRAQRVAEYNDIFYQTVRPYQRNNFLFQVENSEYPFVFSTGYAQIRTNINASFLFTKLQTNNFVNTVLARCTGTSYPAINSNDLGKILIYYPSCMMEQDNIGKLFQTIDNLLTLYQRKLDLLKQLKRGMLQKLFADNDSKQPELRFDEFNEDWEQRKLKELSDRVMRKNTHLSSLLPLTISAQDGLVDQTTYFHKQVASKQLANYILVKNGEFAYNKSYSVGYPYGAIKRLNKYDNGVLSTLYIVFKPKNVNSDFLEHYYESSKWYKEIYRNAAEGARNHGLLNISATDFFGSHLLIPKDSEEQEKISKLLNLIDNVLALYQSKIDTLTNLKKFLLQQIFI